MADIKVPQGALTNVLPLNGLVSSDATTSAASAVRTQSATDQKGSVNSVTTVNNSASPGISGKDTSSSSNSGPLIGIVLGCVVVVLLSTIVILWLKGRKRKNHLSNPSTSGRTRLGQWPMNQMWDTSLDTHA